jgi:hypothetical protein
VLVTWAWMRVFVQGAEVVPTRKHTNITSMGQQRRAAYRRSIDVLLP